MLKKPRIIIKDFSQTEIQKYNSEYFDKSKASIIRNYFSDKTITNYKEAHIQIYIKDNFILKRLAFPKTIFRSYTLGLKDGDMFYQVPISHKEKNILKDLIVQINHNIYYNI